jgi:hypothetical protein
MDHRTLRTKLEEAGCRDLTDETVREFAHYLDQYESGSSREAHSTPKRQSPRRARTRVQVDPAKEEYEWSTRLQNLQARARDLDRELAQCVDLCQDRPSASGLPLYLFNFEDFKDPYPAIAHDKGGRGFIRPPPHICTRKRFPLYKKEVCYPPPNFVAQLRASERKPMPYVPGPTTREDSLRWRLRERLEYSHPDYHGFQRR